MATSGNRWCHNSQNFTVTEDAKKSILGDNFVNSDTIYKVLGAILTGSWLILFTVLLAMTRRIQVAVEVVKQGSRAVFKMPLIVLYPIYNIIMEF